MATDQKSQSDKFKEAARELEADEDEARWEERLKKVAKSANAPVPPRHHDPVSKKVVKRNARPEAKGS
jgi:hypothetical protein